MKSSSIANPYPPTDFTAPRPQQPLEFVNTGFQAQGGQVSFHTSPQISGNPLGQGTTTAINPAVATSMTTLKEEGKSLGVVQIITGLLHIGSGIILGLLGYSPSSIWGFASTAFVGGYTFWGGVSFIISGSLSISASKEFSPCLIKSTLGMNIVSAIFALVGVILLLLDLSINGHPEQDYCAVLSGKGISGILTIFSLLEFGIACATAHFANQSSIHCNRPVLILPTVLMTSPVTQEASTVPPRYDDIPAYAPKH